MWQGRWNAQDRPDWLLFIQPTEPMYVETYAVQMPHTTTTTMTPITVEVATDTQASVLGKRRRAGCDNGLELLPRSKMHMSMKPNIQLANANGSANAFFQFPSSLPTPPSENEFGYELERSTSQHEHNQYQMHPSKQRRRMIPMKKARMPSIDMDMVHTAISPAHTPQQETSPVILTPCHVCYKAPRIKRELDAFEDCWRCHERTCFICMRECGQPGCDRRKVCRSCCVERGTDGDVSCLDCLQRSFQGQQDQEMEM